MRRRDRRLNVPPRTGVKRGCLGQYPLLTVAGLAAYGVFLAAVIALHGVIQ